MKFNATLLEQAKKAMENLKIHPISKIFEDPVEPDECPQVVNSIGLQTIRERLDQNYYSDTYQWLCDVETVFHNIELCYSEVSLEAALSREMRKIFNKERRFLSRYSSSLWMTNAHALRVKLIMRIRLAPPRIRSPIPDFVFVELPKPRQLRFTSHEIQSFQLAEEMLSKDEEEELVKLVKELQPEVFQKMTRMSLNIGQMNDKTLNAVKAFLVNCMKNKNLNYLQ